MLEALINDDLVQMIGPIRQEILSGLKSKSQFHRLKTYLTAFPDVNIHTNDYTTAAQCYNICRSKGIQGSNTDYLICALSVRHQMAIFTTDKDFNNYSDYLPILIHK